MWKLFNIDQDVHDAAGGGSGAAASQDGIAAAAAAASAAGAAEAGAEPAGDGKDKGAAGPDAAAGKTSQAGTWEQDKIVWNGQEITLKREDLIAAAQRGYNVTQREQEIAKQRKELNSKLVRLDQVMAELEKNKGKQPEAEEGKEDPVAKLQQEIESLKTGLKNNELMKTWDGGYAKVKEKYPTVSEKELSDTFIEMVDSGEIDDNLEGLMKAAEKLSKDSDGKLSARLDELLKKSDDPRIKAHDERVIADYVANKTKIADAGGEKGAGASGSPADNEENISQAAARLRA